MPAVQKMMKLCEGSEQSEGSQDVSGMLALALARVFIVRWCVCAQEVVQEE